MEVILIEALVLQLLLVVAIIVTARVLVLEVLAVVSHSLRAVKLPPGFDFRKQNGVIFAHQPLVLGFQGLHCSTLLALHPGGLCSNLVPLNVLLRVHDPDRPRSGLESVCCLEAIVS